MGVELSRPWLIEAGATAEDIDARPEWYAKLYPLLAERETSRPMLRKSCLHVLGG